MESLTRFFSPICLFCLCFLFFFSSFGFLSVLQSQIIDSKGNVRISSRQIDTVQFLLVRDTAAAEAVVVGSYTLGDVPHLSTEDLTNALSEKGYRVQSLTRVRDTAAPVYVNGSYLLAGARGFPADNLVRFLSENGFGQISLNGLGLSLGVGAYYEINRWRLVGEFGVTWPPYHTGFRSGIVQEVGYDAWGVQGQIGRRLLPLGDFEIYSFLGLGIWQGNLTINQMSHVNGRVDEDSFSDIFNDSAALRYAFDNGMANVHLGLAVEYNIPFTKKLSSDSFLTLGLRTEYSIGFSDSWESAGKNEELQGGPDMSTGEWNFWVTMALKTRSFPLRFQ